MNEFPVMILSDSPLSSSGLGRIARELAERMVSIPGIRVGFAGLGGTWSNHLPYPFYPLQKGRGYVLEQLKEVWEDFSHGQKGAIFTIWNHTWLYWMVDGRYCPPEMRSWIDNREFGELWGYIPVDSTRADGTLPMGETLAKFDRLLAYTAFGAAAIGKTTQRPVPDLPHGLETRIFHPLDQKESRQAFGIPVGPPLIGCIATNSERKDWGLVFEIASQIPDAILWCHTDRIKGPDAYWELEELKKIHRLKNILMTDYHYTDEAMCRLYSACDVTIGPGHEGWGMPLSESLACGTPVVTMDWAGQTEFVPSMMRVEPIAFHQTGPGSFLRPVHDAKQWAEKVKEMFALKRERSHLSAKFHWEVCFTQWKKWFLEGIQ